MCFLKELSEFSWSHTETAQTSSVLPTHPQRTEYWRGFGQLKASNKRVVLLLLGATTAALVGCGDGKVSAQIPEDPGETYPGN